MKAIVPSTYDIFLGIPKALSNLVKITVNKKADSNAPTASINKSFLVFNIIWQALSPIGLLLQHTKSFNKLLSSQLNIF